MKCDLRVELNVASLEGVGRLPARPEATGPGHLSLHNYPLTSGSVTSSTWEGTSGCTGEVKQLVRDHTALSSGTGI